MDVVVIGQHPEMAGPEVDPLELRLAARKAIRRQMRRRRRRVALQAALREIAKSLPSGVIWKLPFGMALGYAALVMILVSL